ncbi:unnamed protein product [Peronospora farinosa]|uniref:Uncharacterized protein n=1 Tax=Peronospora farinosa TaxID=134698 RepID=A0AAV0TZ89_9STRA|nr:unnamed protein product [Peronospora farinosa]
MTAMSSSCSSFLCADVFLRAYPQIQALGHVISHLKAFPDVSKVLSVAIAAQNQPLTSQSLTLLEHAAVRERIKSVIGGLN